jgi:hypothetical protein
LTAYAASVIVYFYYSFAPCDMHGDFFNFLGSIQRSPFPAVGAIRTLPVSITAKRQPDSRMAERRRRSISCFMRMESPASIAFEGVRGWINQKTPVRAPKQRRGRWASAATVSS